MFDKDSVRRNTARLLLDGLWKEFRRSKSQRTFDEYVQRKYKCKLHRTEIWGVVDSFEIPNNKLMYLILKYA